MIARLLVVPFGSVWSLKQKCASANRFVSKLSQVIYRLYQYENGSSVAWNAKFASEPCFPHGMSGVFISGSAEIGSDCVIFQQVTIGSITLPDAKNVGAPSIGNNVYIGSGAKIIGNIKIGNNVRIGANTVVYEDVPDNSVVVSAEQKVISKDAPLDNRFYSYHGKWVYFQAGKYHEVTDQNVIQTLNQSQNI